MYPLSRLMQRLQLVKRAVNSAAKYPFFRLKYGKLGVYIAYSRRIPGWTTDREAIARAQVCYALPPHAVVVEIGSFLGSSTVLFAGARKLRGSGIVHCVDPFDASGDDYSIPFYRAIADAQKSSLRHRFDDYIRRAGLDSWVHVHQGTAVTIAAKWTEPVDMLFLDGDQSPQGARASYDSWIPFLKEEGIIAISNTADRIYAEGHDGHRRLAEEVVRPPQYIDIARIGATTFARRAPLP